MCEREKLPGMVVAFNLRVRLIFCEFKASLDDRVSSGTARAAKRLNLYVNSEKTW